MSNAPETAVPEYLSPAYSVPQKSTETVGHTPEARFPATSATTCLRLAGRRTHLRGPPRYR